MRRSASDEEDLEEEEEEFLEELLTALMADLIVVSARGHDKGSPNVAALLLMMHSCG